MRSRRQFFHVEMIELSKLIINIMSADFLPIRLSTRISVGEVICEVLFFVKSEIACFQ